MRIPSLLLLALALLSGSCSPQPQPREVSSLDPAHWAARRADHLNLDSLAQGLSYLPVYSQIYSQNEHKTHDLTVTVSLHNISPTDTLFVRKADYFNTGGQLIRSYFAHPIYVRPLETIEIIIDEKDRAGGAGANFLLHWAWSNPHLDPLFEAVMISTYGQQGLSFSTRAVRIQ